MSKQISNQQSQELNCGENIEILQDELKKTGWDENNLGAFFQESVTDPKLIAKFVVRAMLHGPITSLEDKGFDKALQNEILDKAINGPMRHDVYHEIEAELQEEFKRFIEIKNKTASNSSPQDLSNDYTFIQHALNFLPLVNVKRHNLGPKGNPFQGDFKLQIPVYSANKWKLVPYHLELLDLTPSNRHINTVYSYAFNPVVNNKDEAPAFLVHSGTTPSSMDGELAQLFTDAFPFAEVGGTLWFTGKDNLNQWLNKQNKVFMSGVSLGGSLAMMTARNCESPHVLERVTAINPGKLLFPINESQKHKPTSEQTWCVIRQKGDLLGAIGGFYPKGFDVINVQLTADTEAEMNRACGPLSRHILRHSSSFFGYENGAQYDVNRPSTKLELLLAPLLWIMTVTIRALAFAFLMLPLAIYQYFKFGDMKPVDNVMTTPSTSTFGFYANTSEPEAQEEKEKASAAITIPA